MQKFFDDRWSEMIYNIISKLSKDQLLMLDAKELYHVKTDTNMKRFATHGGIDAQLAMLTKLGYDFFLGLYPHKVLLPDVMRKAYSQHSLKETRHDVILEMLEKKIFLIDNKSIATALAMMAQNFHSGDYVINGNFMKLPKFIEQYQKSNDPLAQLLSEHNPNNSTAEYRDALRSLDLFNSFVGETFKAEEYMETVFKITKLDYLILYELFRFRNSGNYVSVEYLKRSLTGGAKSKAVPGRCTFLFKDRNLIDKYPAKGTPMYTIKASGILLLGDIMNLIINKATKS